MFVPFLRTHLEWFGRGLVSRVQLRGLSNVDHGRPLTVDQ